MKCINMTKIGNNDFSLVTFPFASSVVKFRGINLTVIVLVPVEFDDLSITCDKFINLSNIKCKKISVVASTYVNMGMIESENVPEIKTSDRARYHSFNPREEEVKKIRDIFWDSIEEKVVEVSPDYFKTTVVLSDEGIIKGVLAVNEAVHDYSPQRVRKY